MGSGASSGSFLPPKTGAEGPASEIEQFPNDEGILKADVLIRQHNKSRGALMSAMSLRPYPWTPLTSHGAQR